MVKLLGSVLVAASAAWFGFRAAERLRGQLRAMDELAAGLSLLEQELELSAPELSVLMERVSRRSRGAARTLFESFGTALSGERDGCAAVLWEKCVTRTEELIPEGKACLAPLGEILGRYDSREQRICVAAVRRRLENLREREGARCESRCRTCRAVALSGGAFLIILLI